MHSKLLPAILAIGLACGAGACASEDDTPTTTPSPSVTDAFPGTLAPNGGRTHDFSVAGGGSVRATLTKFTGLEGAELADPNVKIGLSLGTWNGTSCSAVTANDKAGLNTFVTATAGSAGRLCVRVYDAAGTLTETVAYEVTVVHP